MVDKGFEPGIGSFNLTGHVSKLETNHRVIDEFLAEGATFMCVFYAFFVADTGETETLDDYTNSFVIEVCHDDYDIVSGYS